MLNGHMGKKKKKNDDDDSIRNGIKKIRPNDSVDRYYYYT